MTDPDLPPGRRVSLVLAAVAAFAGGCSTPPPPAGPPIECYPVTGSVLVNGSPAPRARVNFHPAPPRDDLPQTFKLVTDDAGRFVGSTNTVGDGLPPGRYVVTVTWPEELGDTPETETDRLQNRYADPKRPRLTVEVRKQSNEIPPFQLR